MKRRVAVAIPAKNEGERIRACLARLTALQYDARIEELSITVVANNCSDKTAETARGFGHNVDVKEIVLHPSVANAGHARSAALELAAARLKAPEDILMCTDADTIVSHNWLSKTIDYIDAGYDAVAGLARFLPVELRSLAPRHRHRLMLLRRYNNALDYLKAQSQRGELWPRHFYEGGASIALTYRMYLELGTIPTPPSGEDKALFDAIRKHGGNICHPLDVRVNTSCRTLGRAANGTSDTIARWQNLSEDEPIHDVSPINVSLGLVMQEDLPLTFGMLTQETKRARDLVRIAKANCFLQQTA